MRTLLARLSGASGWTLTLLTLGVAVLIAGIVWLLARRSSRKDEEGLEASSDSASRAEDDRAADPEPDDDAGAGLKESFRGAVRAIRSRLPGREGIYRSPWILVLGPEGAGKTTLLERSGLPRAFEKDPPGSDDRLEWFFFDQGVALDVPGRLVLEARGTDHDESGWRAFRRQLRRSRPERPLEGVVLALPADELIEAEGIEGSLVPRARALFDRLSELQSSLAVRFPVYVTVTRCDRIPGFGSFASALEPPRRAEMLGWSSPYGVEAAYSSDWPGEAVEETRTGVARMATGLLTRGRADDPDGAFLFADHLAALRGPLERVLDELFKETAYHEAFFLRGVYFVGDPERADGSAPRSDGPASGGEPMTLHAGVEEEADAPDPPPPGSVAAASDVYPTESGAGDAGPTDEARPGERASSAAAGEDAGEEDRDPGPAFVHDLLVRKIFPERGLARASSRGFLARGRMVRAAQIAILAVVVVGGIGLGWSHWSMTRARGPVLELLRDLRTDLDHVHRTGDGSTRDELASSVDVTRLLRGMGNVSSGRIWSPFVPESWFSPVHEEISVDLVAAFHDVILPAMRRGLLDRAAAVAVGGGGEAVESGEGSGREARADPAAIPEYRALQAHLAEVRRLNANVARFNTLARESASDLTALRHVVSYVFQEDLGEGFTEHASYYERALRSATEDPITSSDSPGFTAGATSRAVDLTQGTYEALLGQFDRLDRRLERIRSGGEVDLESFRQVRDGIELLESVVGSAEAFWFDPEAPLGGALGASLDSIPTSRLLDASTFGERYARSFERIRRDKLTGLQGRMTSMAALGGDPALVQTDSMQFTLSPELVALRDGITTLLDQPFFDPLPGEPSRQPASVGSRPTWNLEPLDLAVTHFEEFRAFADDHLAAFPPALRRSARSVSAAAVNERIHEALTRAMTYEVAVESAGRQGMKSNLRSRILAFDEAAKRMVTLLEIEGELGGAGSSERVAMILSLEVVDILQSARRLLEQSRPYQASLGGWSGGAPAAFSAFGVEDPDGLDAYLSRQRSIVREIVDPYVSPVMGFLELEPVERLLRYDGQTLSREHLALIEWWRAAVEELDAHAAQTPGNAVARLEQFVRTEMMITGPRECGEMGGSQEGSRNDDVFTRARIRLSRGLEERCRTLVWRALDEGYGQIRDLYVRRLSDRFPFEAPDPGVSDVSGEAMEEFFRLYDRMIAPYESSLSSVLGRSAAGSSIAAFLREAGVARRLFSPLLDAPEAEEETAPPGALEYEVDFRVERNRERGGEQVVDWALDVDGRVARYGDPEAGRTGVWRPGQPVALHLRWAEQSSVRPRRVTGDEGPRVQGSEVTYRYGGPWALFRLVARHRAGAGAPLSRRGEPGLLHLRVPTTLRTAADDEASRESPALDTAALFVRVRLRDPLSKARLRVPDFPDALPPFPERGRAPSRGPGAGVREGIPMDRGRR